jgi:hypothetical protein
MICRICGEDINEKGQDNVSPISGYPVCEDCKDDIMCYECCEGNYGGNLYYVEECDRILCRSCLVAWLEEKGYINSTKTYYDEEWNTKLGTDDDYSPIIEHIKEIIDIQEVQGE